MAAAKAPAKNRAKIRSGMVDDEAMTKEESAAPTNQRLNVLRRPICGLEDKDTIKGHINIWAMEKALVDIPTWTGVAPSFCKCSGKVERAMPSEIIRAKTVRRMGVTVEGKVSPGTPPGSTPASAWLRSSYGPSNR